MPSWRQARREWVITVSRILPIGATLILEIVNVSILRFHPGGVKHKGRLRERDDLQEGRAAGNGAVLHLAASIHIGSYNIWYS